jgi:hypothetical protein
MKKRSVNLGKTDENIADQYPNIFEGIQKDAAQNSWDAKITKKGRDWKLIFKYIHDRNILVIEDFGTFGMNKERWSNYQSLWDTTKAEESSLGARGQGKFLFHYFSAEKLVLTETIDEQGQYRFSYGTTDEWDETNKNLNDFIPGANNLDHQGTRIWIMNVKKELLEDLLNYNEFIKYIVSTWWEIMRNYEATFIVDFNGVERKVSLPEFPKVVKENHFEGVRIKDFGKIKNLRLFYCNNKVPEHFNGIAIQRGGMTIIRLSVKAEDSIKAKIYGYCNFDEKLESELKKVEQPNHFGFTNKREWNHTKEYIIGKVDEFVQEITPKKQKVMIEDKFLNEAAKIVNELFAQYAPELADSPKGRIPRPPKPSKPPKPKLPVRIDVFRGNAKEFKYNETLKTECEIINETDLKKELYFYLEISHKRGAIKHKAKYFVEIDTSGRYTFNIPLIDFNEKIDKKGEYKAVGILKESKSNEQLDKRSFSFYLEQEPPPPGKAFMAKFDIIVTAKNLFFEKWRNLPINDKGTIRVIWDHPDFVHVRERRSSKKAQKIEIFLYLIKIGLDEGIKELTVFKNNENILDLDEIKRLYNIRDEMYFDAVKKVVERD